MGRLMFRPPRDKVNLDQGIDSECGDPHAGPGGQCSGLEIGLVRFIHRLVVTLELGQIDPCHGHVGEVQAKSVEHQDKVVHRPSGLRLDTGWKRSVGVVGVGWHLPGDEHPSVGFDGVGKRRYRAWRTGDHVMARN